MGNCRTISHTFYSPIYPVDEGNEDVGLVSDNILFFFLFGVNQVHCFGLKPGTRGECLMCIVSAKITELRGRLKCQQGDTSWVWYYVLIAAGSRLTPCICSLVDSPTALNRRRPSPISGRAGHHSINFSEIVKFLLKTNDGRVERPGWAILSATYISAKTREQKGSISSHCLYGQALCTWYGTFLLLLLLLALFT